MRSLKSDVLELKLDRSQVQKDTTMKIILVFVHISCVCRHNHDSETRESLIQEKDMPV